MKAHITTFIVALSLSLQSVYAVSAEEEGVVLCTVDGRNFGMEISTGGVVVLNSNDVLKEAVYTYLEENNLDDQFGGTVMVLSWREALIDQLVLRMHFIGMALYDKNLIEREGGDVVGDSFWSFGFNTPTECQVIQPMALCEREITNEQFSRFTVFGPCE